jgi:hypothetical protein
MEFTSWKQNYNYFSIYKNATERTGNTSNPGGNENDYVANDSNEFNVTRVNPTKSIVSTNETQTNANLAGQNKVAIGEIIRYELVVVVSETTMPNMQIQENLPSGLQFLDDETSKVAFISNTNRNIDEDCIGTIASPSTSGGTTSDENVTFNFGNILNPDDNKSSNNSFVIRVNVLVVNQTTNQNGTQLINLTWQN